VFANRCRVRGAQTNHIDHTGHTEHTQHTQHTWFTRPSFPCPRRARRPLTTGRGRKCRPSSWTAGRPPTKLRRVQIHTPRSLANNQFSHFSRLPHCSLSHNCPLLSSSHLLILSSLTYFLHILSSATHCHFCLTSYRSPNYSPTTSRNCSSHPSQHYNTLCIQDSSLGPAPCHQQPTSTHRPARKPRSA